MAGKWIPRRFDGMYRTNAGEIVRNEFLLGEFVRLGTIDEFEDGVLENWSFGGSAGGIALAETFLNAPQKSVGRYCLEIARDCSPASAPCVATRRFPEPLDLSGATALSFAIDSHGCVPMGNLLYVRVTVSDGQDRFSRKFSYACDTWNVLTMDISACPFRGKIRSLEFSFENNSKGDIPWDGRYQIGRIFYGKEFDMRFAEEGNTQGFTAENGTLSASDDALVLISEGGTSSVLSPERQYNRNRDAVYHVGALRNAICVYLENGSGAEELEAEFFTARGGGKKRFPIAPHACGLYPLVFADVPEWNDGVKRFRLSFCGMKKGECVRIGDISFQEENAARYAGRLERIDFDRSRGVVDVTGAISAEALEAFSGGELCFYVVTPECPEPDGEPLLKLPVPGGEEFSCSVPFMRSERKTYLDCDLCATLEDQMRRVRLDKNKGITNVRELFPFRYGFETPKKIFPVGEFGARGDGFHDDTAAICRAIDAATACGGGQVVLGGGRTYVATNLLLKDNVTLVIERGSVLRQSDDPRDYRYRVELGHDSKSYSHITWGATQLVSNLPLIQAHGAKHVKVTGGGTIRMSDTDNCGDDLIERDFPLDLQFQVCARRIHVLPIGFFQVDGAEISDIEIVRCSGFHIALYFSKNITVANVRLHEVRCASSDGVSLYGAQNVEIYRLSYYGNDDGVVLVTSYYEPRGTLWFHSLPETDQSVRDVTVRASYVNSGGGKAIAFISWGSSSPDPEKVGIRDISVRDCTLKGGYSVGTWADNPYNGKFPFDNTETDDFSCVQDVDIVDNLYLSPCGLSPNLVTGFVTDCGLEGERGIVNADFAQGFNYWRAEGGRVQGGGAELVAGERPASLSQGVFLGEGKHIFSAVLDVSGEAELSARDERTGKLLGKFPLPEGCGRVEFPIIAHEAGSCRIALTVRKGKTVLREPSVRRG